MRAMPFLTLELTMKMQRSPRCEKLCMRSTTEQMPHLTDTLNDLAATDYLGQQQTRVAAGERERKREINRDGGLLPLTATR